MESKPPALIEQIEWLRLHFTKYILHIALAGSLYFGYTTYDKLAKLEVSSKYEIETLKSRLIDYQGCKTISPYGDKPLQVNFLDKHVAYVNTFSMIKPSSKAVVNEHYLSSYYKRYELSLNQLQSVIFSELENLNSGYVRKNRELVAEKIKDKVNLKFAPLELEMVQFELLEICSVKA